MARLGTPTSNKFEKTCRESLCGTQLACRGTLVASTSYFDGERVRLASVSMRIRILTSAAPPREYGREYRYTIVNDRTVLVDPRTHRIVQIIG
jgi:hypothetical protein